MAATSHTLVDQGRKALLERISFLEVHLPAALARHICGKARALLDMGELGKAHSMLSLYASVAAPRTEPPPELHGLQRTIAALKKEQESKAARK